MAIEKSKNSRTNQEDLRTHMQMLQHQAWVYQTIEDLAYDYAEQ